MNQTIVALSKEFREFKTKHEELSAELKDLNAKWGQCEASLLEAMADEGVKSLVIEGVGRVTMRVTNYLSVNVADKPRFFSYLQDAGHGDLLKLDVNPKTLTSFLSKHLEELQTEIVNNEGLDMIEAREKALGQLKAEGANYFTKRDISLTKGD